jgi:hypothetical protein
MPDHDEPSAPPARTPSPSPPESGGGPQPISEETQLLYELIGDRHVLTVIVLVGASALIPVPFLDDVAKGYLERRLLRAVADNEKMPLSSEEVGRLTLEPSEGCCLMGCLGNLVLYPIKKILRKIFFFLEVKRTIDQSSTALAEAWLFALALRRRLWSPGRDLAEADLLREVIDASCCSQGVKPLELAVSQAFQGAKSTMIDIAGRFSGRRGDSKDKLEAALRQFEVDESERLAGLSERLSDAVSGMSEGYLQRFAEGFEKGLQEARERSPRPS